MKHFKHTSSYGSLEHQVRGGGGWCRMLLVSLLALALTQVEMSRAAEPLLGGAFKVCSRNDRNLEQCILDSLNGAREQLTNGVPELGLPPLEPLRGRRLLMHEGEEEFNMQLTFNNYTWSGLSDYVATKARLQFSPPYLELVTTHKNMSVSSPYVLRGSILTLRINGNGDSFVKWGAHVTHRLRLEEERRGGEIFWRVADYSWKQDMFHFHCSLKNLFRGNKRLGTYANQFLNRNWKPGYAVYGAVIERPLADAVREQLLEPLLARIPTSRLFAP